MDGHTAASHTSNGLLAVLGIMSLQQWAIIVGLILSAITCIINWRYKRWYYRKMLEQNHEYHEEMLKIERGEE